MLDKNQLVSLMFKLQELSMLDSFMLHQVKEEDCFNLIFEYEAPFTNMVKEGIYIWIWTEQGLDVHIVDDMLKSLGISTHYNWDDNYIRHHWVIRIS